MNDYDFTARYDPDTGAVICGNEDYHGRPCRGRFGDIANDKKPPMQFLGKRIRNMLPRIMRFDPGWYRGDDDIIRISTAARRRLERGQAPRTRRPRRGEGVTYAAGKALSAEGYSATVGLARLPSIAICWKCERKNLIDWRELGTLDTSDIETLNREDLP